MRDVSHSVLCGLGFMYCSHRRRALLKPKQFEKVDETWMYGIASVVTPVQHLRQLKLRYIGSEAYVN
jgi:hypothetical protein